MHARRGTTTSHNCQPQACEPGYKIKGKKETKRHIKLFQSSLLAFNYFLVSRAQQRAEAIQKLAHFAVKNGASFVELIKVNQKDNPEYQFLFGGEGCDYYRWVLYCACQGLPADQPVPSAQQQPHHQAQLQQSYSNPQESAVQDVGGMLQQTLATCDPEVKSGFAQVLAALSGSKVSKIFAPTESVSSAYSACVSIEYAFFVCRSPSSKVSSGSWHAFHMRPEWLLLSLCMCVAWLTMTSSYTCCTLSMIYC